MPPYNEEAEADDNNSDDEDAQYEIGNNEVMGSSEANITPETPKETQPVSDLEQFMMGGGQDIGIKQP